jgi:hypothetical protein
MCRFDVLMSGAPPHQHLPSPWMLFFGIAVLMITLFSSDLKALIDVVMASASATPLLGLWSVIKVSQQNMVWAQYKVVL